MQIYQLFDGFSIVYHFFCRVLLNFPIMLILCNIITLLLRNLWNLQKNNYLCGDKTFQKMRDTDYIRFDWAIKRLLRDKANFGILEGLFTVLLGRKVEIVEVLESESNQQTLDDKFNRVDMMVKAEDGELFIVEVQLTRDLYFMQRILYGTSKAITEHIRLGESYKNVKKVYSINILYFDLGTGKDFLYHGTTTFKGVFQKDVLEVNKREKEYFDKEMAAVGKNIFPEYYLIRVNQFNEVAKTPIEEWLDFLKNGKIKENTTTPGLKEAEEKLRIATMSEKERKEYFAHVDAIMSQNDTIETYKKEGRDEGEAIGLARGLEKGRAEGAQAKALEMAKKMLAKGFDKQTVADLSGLSLKKVEEL